ncbi:Thiol-specific monooxygenase 1 [Colletotrichum sojae]|uniref:Thiol-specific monooxygenase 1 n=1 Tax=Colletotrichum sojae TaxID=2175907 RepID=A0A8H6JN11_9PEZI|nr:Thiol-specific monooxygenase 1 [Colletotrichum sojae]
MSASAQKRSAPAASRFTRRISEFDITGILRGPRLPRLIPEFLASDVAGFILTAVLATDWTAFWKARLFRAFPFSEKAASALSDFWTAFRQERWHTSDPAEEKPRSWSPHLWKPAPPRLRTYREILNRQQALRNCCDEQMRDLETRDVVWNLLLQVALALCWAWALLGDHVSVVRLLAEIEDGGDEGFRKKIEESVPPVVRKGEGVMPVADGARRCCLNRVQDRISRGQGLITRFAELELCRVDRDCLWDETDWLVETDGEIPAEMPDEDRFLVNRVVFSAGLSWFMVSISCDFATFYLFVLGLRLRQYLFG